MSVYNGTYTDNLSLSKDNIDDNYDVERVNTNTQKIDDWAGGVNETLSNHTASLSDFIYPTAGGTATALTVQMQTLVNGYAKTFIASTNNGGAATTINGKPLYKPGTTTAPNLISGKAYTVWYNSTGGCFFIKASAEGDAVAANVLATKKFSNDNDTGLTGTMPNNGAVNQTLAINGIYTIPVGYHNGSGKITQNVVTKAGATYNPSTVQQIISAGQYLTADQIIAAVAGNATTADVVAGKTFSSANGINQTGTATMASLGGKLYASSTVTSSSGTIGVTTTGNYALSRATVSVTGLTFTPSRIKVKYAYNSDLVDISEYDSSISGNLYGAINIFNMQTSGSISGYCIKQDANVKVTSNGFVFPVSYSNAAYTWEAYA